MNVRLYSIAYGAQGVLLYDLRDPLEADLPTFEPGAHLDVEMPSGIVRSYSLLNDSAERHRYVLGVKCEPVSRGGSAWLHKEARVGMILKVSAPRNDFKLVEDASLSVFIAGGIGITPLWSMAQRLMALERPWKLYYRSRSRTTTAFLRELAAPKVRDAVHLSFSDEVASERLDIAKVVRGSPAETHFYCCGPLPMLESFEAGCASLPPEYVHAEYFQAKDAPATEGGYVVHLARSGKTVPISPGRTILEALASAGVGVTSSCQQGVCGACETKVLSGIPDHRDLVLSDVERRSGTTMMICCSGCLTAELVLDL